MDSALGSDTVSNMTQDVFNLTARNVNKEFVQLGYPTILTKKSGRDFVNLCALMQNCSTVLRAVKARSMSDKDFAAVVMLRKSSSNSQKQQKKRGGLFNSKALRQQQQQSADLHIRLSAEVSRAMGFCRDEFDTVYEGIADAVRRHVEQVIEITRCLHEPDSGAGDQPTEQQLLLFFTTRWVQFKDAVLRRLLEAAQLSVEVQSLKTASGKGLPGAAAGQRSKSATTAGENGTGLASRRMGGDSESDLPPGGVKGGELGNRMSRRHSLSRHHLGATSTWLDAGATATSAAAAAAAAAHVSVTKVPSLEAEIRRLKLELTRREHRHKEELDRRAKERERLERDFRHAQRRITGPRWPINACVSLQHQNQQNSETSDVTTLEALDRLADCCLSRRPRRMTTPPSSDIKQQPQQVLAYAYTVSSAALTRIQSLQADCHTSSKRQADLEVFISILKARLDLTGEQLTNVGKFEAAITDIARRLPPEGESQPQQLQPPQQQPPQPAGRNTVAAGDESSVINKDSLVSRLTSRLRERQKPATGGP